MNEKNELHNAMIGILSKNSKFDILQIAYAYKKKTKYPHQNGLVKIISDSWGITFPDKHYSSYKDIQLALADLDFDVLSTYMEYLLNSIKRVCGDYLFSQSKYKYLRFLYIKFQDYYKSIEGDEIIGWINSVDLELYNDIKRDINWRDNFFVHISKIHTAFHTLLIILLKDESHKRETIVNIYSLLFKNSKLSSDDISLLKLDTKIVSKLNKLRNDYSKSHPNSTMDRPQISQDTGILFLKDVSRLVAKLKSIF